MNLRTLLVHLTLATALAATASADPAAQLRELDRLLKEGRISQAEYDRRWDAIIAEGTNPASVPRIQLAARAKPARVLNEFSLSGVGGLAEIGDQSELVYGARAMVGRFFTPNVQISVGADYGRGEVEGEDFSSVGALAAIDLHFNPAGTYVPYVGVSATWARIEIGEASDSDWRWEAHVGIKQYLADDTALKYELSGFDHRDLDIRGVTASIGVCFLF